MISKKISLSILMLISGILVFSQNIDTQEFKPSGKVILRTFFDFSQGFSQNSDHTGFNITRAFLGYSYQFTPTLSATLIVDAAAGNANGNIEPHLRNAFVSWTPSKLTLHVGASELYQFLEQEKYWRLRYLLPTAQALYGFGHAADLGVTAVWNFNKFLSVDASVLDGEGYKKIVQNSSTRYAAGISVHPINNFILRAYADIYNQSAQMRDVLPETVNVTQTVNYVNQTAFSFFAGYLNSFFSGGIECNKVWNKGFIQGKNLYGFSGFASVNFAKKWLAFARYDRTNSQRPAAFTADWNTTDGQFFITGVQFQPIKQLKIAPNFRYNYNKLTNKKDSYLFVNMEFVL